MKVKIPDLKAEYLLMYKDRFLELNGLKIGDTIVWFFNYDKLRSEYKSRKMNRYGAIKKSEGILKEDERGFLFVESLEDFNFYRLTNNGLTGRSKREWYQKEVRKSTHYFGTGFIYIPKKRNK